MESPQTSTNLTQEIQLLEFMGGSNSMHAHSNYLLCMRFIQIITVEFVMPNVFLHLDIEFVMPNASPQLDIKNSSFWH